MKINREKFFTGYRETFGSLNQSQVDGLDFLLDKLEKDTFSLKQTAYILATIHHETGVKRNGELQTFQPVKELRERPSSPRRKNQDRYWLTGYYGRGYVQITWKDNYQKFGIASNPDQALEPETAYEITSRGMREGLFTGKKLSDFINGKADYRNARKIINGLDRADEIAAKAHKWESVLTSSQESVSQESEKPENEDKGVTTSEKPAEETEGTPPPAPAVEIKASSPSLTSKIAALSIPTGAGAVLSAIWGFVQNMPPWGWAVLGGVFIVAMLIGAWLYNESMKRAAQRTQTVMNAAADPGKNNLRLV